MAPKEQSLEDTFLQLEQILDELDAEDISLEESFDLYTQGMKLVKSCNAKIEKVEKKLRIITESEQEKEIE